MNLSMNELFTLAKRATRGAGCSWGIAEDAGMAARWLARFDLPGAVALADLLPEIDGKDVQKICPTRINGNWTNAGPICPLHTGALVSDLASELSNGTTLTFHDVRQPLLLLPFVAWASVVAQNPVKIEIDDVQIVTDGTSISQHLPNKVKRCATAVVSLSDVACGIHPSSTREVLDDTIIAQLTAFAHRIYAPATEESRLLGAGAGVSDND